MSLVIFSTVAYLEFLCPAPMKPYCCSISISEYQQPCTMDTKWESYFKFYSEDKAMKRSYASANRVTKALKHFKQESTLQDWKRAYELAVHEK